MAQQDAAAPAQSALANVWAQVQLLEGPLTTEPYDVGTVVRDLAATFVVMTAVYSAVVIALSRSPRVAKSLLGTQADDVFNLAYLPLLCGLSLVSSLRLGMAGLEGRWTQSCPSAYWFLVFYVAKNAMRTATAMVLQDKKAGRELILVHHIISCVAYTYGLLHARALFFATFAGLCEVTIVPVNFARVWSSFMCMAKRKRYAVNAILGWVLWIVFRLLLFPFWLYLFLTDYLNNREELEEYIPLPWAAVFTLTIVVLFGMSAVWFVSVHKGMVRAVEAFQQSGDAPRPEIPKLRLSSCAGEPPKRE